MKRVRLFAMALLIVGLLASNVFAAEFVSSVESQEAPTVNVEQTVLTDKDGNKVELTTDSIIVTPASEADQAAPEISEALTSALEQVKKVDSLADLPSKDGSTLKDDLNQALTDAKIDCTADDLAVSELFDVSLSAEASEALKNGGKITLNFTPAVKYDGEPIVIHNLESDTWEVIDPANVVLNADGTVSVTLTSLSPIAFLAPTSDDENQTPADDTTKPATDSKKPTSTTTNGGKTVTSPQTGETSNVYVVCASVMLLAAAAFCATRAKRVAR
jgi:hypothetical protein